MMKKTHVVRSVFISLLLVVCISSVNVCAGTLHFKMTAPKTLLAINEEITVTVSAFIDDPIASPDNGLDTWQLDLSVDNTGVIAITKTGSKANINLIAPNPDTDWSGWNAASVNSPVTGEVREVAVVQENVGAPSYIGVNGYSNIFTFKIKGLSPGMASYTIGDDSGSGFFAFLSDGTYYSGSDIIFDAGISDRTFIVPEPVTFTLFAFAGLLASLRKRLI